MIDTLVKAIAPDREPLRLSELSAIFPVNRTTVFAGKLCSVRVMIKSYRKKNTFDRHLDIVPPSGNPLSTEEKSLG